MTALAAILGAATGLGLVLIICGWRASEDRVERQMFRLARVHRDRLAVRMATAVGAVVLVGAVTGWPVAAVFAGAGTWLLPKMVGGSKERARQIARTEAIAGWAEMLRDTLSAAAGLEQAIVATARVSPLPIRAEVTTLANAIETERLVPALRRLAHDLADPTGDLVVAALILAAGHEARKLSDLLGSLASAARDEAAMRLRIDAGRARIRTSTNVVVGSTLIFAVGLTILNRSYLDPFDSTLGQGVLVIIGLVFAGSFWWLQSMGRPAAPERILTPPRNSSDDGVDETSGRRS
ncbi:MAG: type II secretion system F family protein [Acidimicrobiales bacterium]